MGPITGWVTLPVGLCVGLIIVATGQSEDRASEGSTPLFLSDLLLLLICTAAFAAVAVLLSRAHTEMAGGNPWPHVVSRFVPWLAALCLSAVAAFLGFLLLIVPGIVIGARLFWADEFALIHRQGPVTSVRQSLELTRGLAGRVFSFQFVLGFAGYAVWIPILIAFFAGAAALEQLESNPLRTLLSSVGMTTLGLHGYAALHAPEVAYFYGLRALRAKTPEEDRTGDWVGRALRGEPGLDAEDSELCPSCGATWKPSEYRRDADAIFCSYCKAELTWPA